MVEKSEKRIRVLSIVFVMLTSLILCLDFIKIKFPFELWFSCLVTLDAVLMYTGFKDRIYQEDEDDLLGKISNANRWLCVSIFGFIVLVIFTIIYVSFKSYDYSYLLSHKEESASKEHLADAEDFFYSSKVGTKIILERTSLGQKYQLYRAVLDSKSEIKKVMLEPYYGSDEVLKNISDLSKGYMRVDTVNYSNAVSMDDIDNLNATQQAVEYFLFREYKLLVLYEVVVKILILIMLRSVYVKKAAIESLEIIRLSKDEMPEEAEQEEQLEDIEEDVEEDIKDEVIKPEGVTVNDDTTITISEEVYNNLKSKLDEE